MSGEVKSFSYLLQRIAVAVQRGNAVSILGTFASEDCLVFEDSDTCYYAMYVFYVFIYRST